MAQIARPFPVETVRATEECPLGTFFYVEAQTDGHYLGLWAGRVVKVRVGDCR